jgi:hypothetical protein
VLSTTVAIVAPTENMALLPTWSKTLIPSPLDNPW